MCEKRDGDEECGWVYWNDWADGRFCENWREGEEGEIKGYIKWDKCLNFC